MSIIGLIALALGGTGYVERVYDVLVSLLSYVLLSEVTIGKKENRRVLISGVLMLFSVVEGVLYFSGWNFQSIPYSETENFILTYGPSVNGVYLSSIYLKPLFYLVYPYERAVEKACLYIEDMHNNIQGVYYLLGNPEIISVAERAVKQEFSLIYSTPTRHIFVIMK